MLDTSVLELDLEFYQIGAKIWYNKHRDLRFYGLIECVYKKY